MSLMDFIYKNCPRLSWAEPLTEAQEKILIQDYGEDKVKDMLLRIEAYEKKNYKTIYRTVRNWFKIQRKSNNNKYYVG